MKQALSYLLLLLVGLLASVGFIIGILLGPLVHGIMLGIEQVSSYIDRNSGP